MKNKLTKRIKNKFGKKRNKKTLKRKHKKDLVGSGTSKKQLKDKNPLINPKSIEARDNFRNMFINSFKKITDILKNQSQLQDKILLEKAVKTLNNGFKSNQLGINNLIPVTNNYIPINKFNYQESETPLIGFVSCLVPIIENIDDEIIVKNIITSFIQNKGNINLKSYLKNITALSVAIEKQNKELVNFLINNGADINMLTEEQDSLLDLIIPIEDVKEETIINLESPIIKLNLEMPLSDSLDTEFWSPIFINNNLLELKQKINSMMLSDFGNESNTWSVCKIIQSLIPTYYVPTKIEPYMVYNTLYVDTPEDFSKFNIILCASLLVLGIISEKMKGQDYKLIFKGGKAIQLELTNTQEYSIYKSEDIDVLIAPTQGVQYDELKVKNLAGHIAFLIKWILNIPESKFDISVLEPNPSNERANKYIYKLSYIKSTKRYDYKRREQVPEFKQFSDIDFKEVPNALKPYFEQTSNYTFDIEELNEKVLFICPNIGALLDEKIYYYSKYFEFKIMLTNKNQIVEDGYQSLTIPECERLLDKFKRAIMALNKGLQKTRFPDIDSENLLEKEKNSILNRLKKIGVTEDAKRRTIMDSLF
jgi:hypothetical protein